MFSVPVELYLKNTLARQMLLFLIRALQATRERCLFPSPLGMLGGTQVFSLWSSNLSYMYKGLVLKCSHLSWVDSL